MNRRGFKKRTKKRYPKGYDSGLEYDLHQHELKGCDHHTSKLSYNVPHSYEPDFVPKNDPYTLIEVKGRFRDSTEARKYVEIARCNPEYTLVFIFQDPLKPMPFAQRRRDGTKRTHAEWAIKNGFEFYCPKTIPKKWSS